MFRLMPLILALFLSWSSAATAKELRFPEITGWKQQGEVHTFSPETLYEHINGAADLYLAYYFEELRVAEYVNAHQASVVVEAYRHGSPRDAFGIYSQERLPDGHFLNIGAQGYIDANILNFVAGSYYVKLNSFNTGAVDREALQSIAMRVAKNLGNGPGLPAVLAAFPAEGKKIHSEKYVGRNFLGYSFFDGIFTADYEHAGRRFQLFLMEAKDKNDCRNILQSYLRKLKAPDQEVSEGRHTLTDPHHGIIDLFWLRRYLWGTLDLPQAEVRSRYLKLFEEKIKNYSTN